MLRPKILACLSFASVLIAQSVASQGGPLHAGASDGGAADHTGGQLSAQPGTVPGALPAVGIVPIHTAAADPEGGAYGHWAMGSDYKASFDGGMTFIPLLGASAAVNREFRWTTTSVRSGNVELITAPPKPHQVGGLRYEYRYPGVTEAYDLRAEGLEQTFVLPKLPAFGDLVIVGRVDGNLTSVEMPPAHQALSWIDDTGREVVGYGAATAIDAAGQVAKMTTAVRGDAIELRLDAAWLASATYPVTVDPLLTNRVIGVGNEFYDVDLFRDNEQSLSNQWLVYSFKASATDSDLVVRRFLDDFSGPGATVYSDLEANWSSVQGQLAGTGGSNAGKTIAVFTREFTGGAVRVRWHIHAKNDATLQTNYGSANNVGGAYEWRPDVGGSRAAVVGTKVLIVYQRETSAGSTFANTATSEVVGVIVDTAVGQNGQEGPTLDLGGSGSLDEERPAINQLANGGAFGYSWVVAFQSHSNTPGTDWDIVVQRISESGSLARARRIVKAGTHEVSPTIEGAKGRYLLAYGSTDRSWVGGKPSIAASSMVFGRRVDWDHGASNGLVRPERVIQQGSARPTLLVGECAYDLDTESHWLVTVASDTGGTDTYYAHKVGYAGYVAEASLVYNATTFRPLPGGACYDPVHKRFSLAWAVDTGNSGTLWGSHVTYAAVQPPILYGVGCAGNATPFFSGSQHLGGEFEVVGLSRAAPGTVAFLFASFASVATPLASYGMPGCQLLIDPDPSVFVGSYLGVVDSAGRASWNLSVPGFLQPFGASFQGFLVDTNANRAGFVATQGIRVAFDR